MKQVRIAGRCFVDATGAIHYGVEVEHESGRRENLRASFVPNANVRAEVTAHAQTLLDGLQGLPEGTWAAAVTEKRALEARIAALKDEDARTKAASAKLAADNRTLGLRKVALEAELEKLEADKVKAEADKRARELEAAAKEPS